MGVFEAALVGISAGSQRGLKCSTTHVCHVKTILAGDSVLDPMAVDDRRLGRRANLLAIENDVLEVHAACSAIIRDEGL